MGSSNGNPFSDENLERMLHPPGPDTPEKGLLRQEFGTLCRIMKDHVPECAERTLAMRKLQEAMHWCYTAIDKKGGPRATLPGHLPNGPGESLPLSN